MMMALPVFKEKIVFIGDPSSGKSSIVDRYIHNRFNLHAEPTWAMRLGTKSWAISDPAACIVNVELWDTPRGFGSTPAGEQFWQGTRAVVVCVDGQSANCASTASQWLRGSAIAECRKYCPNVLVCLLATKADAFSDHRKENIDSEMQAFADRSLCSTWAQVSAKAMTGIYDKSDFLKQLLHALVSKDLKGNKTRGRLSLLKPRQSIVDATGAPSQGRLSIVQRVSLAGGQLRDLAAHRMSSASTS